MKDFRPQDLFSVPDQVPHLEPAAMRALEDAFAAWRDAATRADGVRARTRLWTVFTVLRHSGARLGEVLALTPDDLDAEAGLLRLGKGGRLREVPLPEAVAAEVAAVLQSPLGLSLGRDFFRLDPGYFRRVCYARGRDCGVERELAGPQVLRNTRAVEMLRSGVPITVVREVLGQSTLNLTAAFQRFSKEDAAAIVRVADKAMRGRTSARNAFAGHVTAVREDAVMAEVRFETRSGLGLCAVITMDSLRRLGLAQGCPVLATIKAPLVNVVRPGAEVAASARNRITARVLRVAATPAMAEVTGRAEGDDVGEGMELCALIGAESAETLALEPGDTVEFWFKALSVVLHAVRV